MSKIMLHIGVDDTDSARGGMCTTYIAALLRERLEKLGRVGELKLVRLNPNIEYKTRGNASVALAVEIERWEEAKKIVKRTVKENSMLEDGETNPGVAFFEGNGNVFREFYLRALRRRVSIGEAEALAEAHGAEIVKYKLGRGIVGALAAIGAGLEEHTYEAIAYRNSENWRKPRRVDRESVVAMDRKTYPLTYNNFDYTQGSALVVPHTPCPVLFGVRGVSRWVVKEAVDMVKAGEEVERVEVFKTNQGTDAHLAGVGSIEEVEPDSSVIVEGEVASKPRVIPGGHVFFELKDSSSKLTCAAFEPTKGFREVVLGLMPGDRVVAYGGVKLKGALTVNLEKLLVKELVRVRRANPLCPVCGKRMESAGVAQGYRCRQCRSKRREKILEPLERSIEERLYSSPPSAMRHLSRPLVWHDSPSQVCSVPVQDLF